MIQYKVYANWRGKNELWDTFMDLDSNLIQGVNSLVKSGAKNIKVTVESVDVNEAFMHYERQRKRKAMG